MATKNIIAGHKLIGLMEDNLEESKVDFHQLKVWKAQLERKMGAIRDLYDEVSKAEDKEVEDLICAQAEFEGRLLSSLFKINDVLEKSQPKKVELKRIKLPTVQLPEFEETFY